jgi:hypothetical protein
MAGDMYNPEHSSEMQNMDSEELSEFQAGFDEPDADDPDSVDDSGDDDGAADNYEEDKDDGTGNEDADGDAYSQALKRGQNLAGDKTDGGKDNEEDAEGDDGDDTGDDDGGEENEKDADTDIASLIADVARLLPEGNIDIDGMTIDLKALEEEMPEETAYARAIAGAAMQKAIASVQQPLQTLLKQVQYTAFWDNVTNGYVGKNGYVEGVPNARRIAMSPEYSQWLKQQPKAIQALDESSNPADSIAVINAFIAKAGRKTGQSSDSSTRARREQKLHGNSSRKTGLPPRRSHNDNGKTEVESLFEGFDIEDDD